MNRYCNASVLACALMTATVPQAQAQTFPAKPIRMVNPAAPGGNSDVFFRLLQPKMTELLGQPVVMDYRPGAGGTVGGEVIARSAPDGYTTGLMAASFVINPAMIQKISLARLSTTKAAPSADASAKPSAWNTAK